MTGYYSYGLTEDRHKKTKQEDLITEQDVISLNELLEDDFLRMVIDDVLCLRE